VLDLHQLPPLRVWHPGHWTHPVSTMASSVAEKY
jgi:hypothetical protein